MRVRQSDANPDAVFEPPHNEPTIKACFVTAMR
jgi:hypothetical protein